MNATTGPDGAGPVADLVPVLVVDDRPAFRAAARAVVEAAPQFVVHAEVDSGEAAVDAAGAMGPGIVLMDIHLGGISGIEACRRITAADPGAVVLLMSTYPERDLPADAHRCGSSGYVHKELLGPSVLADAWNSARR